MTNITRRLACYCIVAALVLWLLYVFEGTGDSHIDMANRQQKPISESCSVFSLIMIDFDGTITASDTCGLMYQATEPYQRGSTDDKAKLDMRWNTLASNYLERHSAFLRQELNNLPVANGNVLSRTTLERFLHEMAANDKKSTVCVEESGILNNLTDEGLEVASQQVVMQDHCENVLKKITERLEIVSVSWSGELIAHSLKGLLRHRSCIHANWLLNGDNSMAARNPMLTRGQLTTAKDKQHVAQRLIKSNKHCGYSVFIGDSMTDLLAMLTADVGILIGSGKSTISVIKRFGIALVPLSELVDVPLEGRHRMLQDDALTIYEAVSWRQIDELLFR